MQKWMNQRQRPLSTPGRMLGIPINMNINARMEDDTDMLVLKVRRYSGVRMPIAIALRRVTSSFPQSTAAP